MLKFALITLIMLPSFYTFSHALIIGEWGIKQDNVKMTYTRERELIWTSDDEVIKKCKEFEWGELDGLHRMKMSTHQQLSDNCNFITLGEKGWVVSDDSIKHFEQF